MKTIKEIRTNYPTISLKRICDETNLCYQYILKASKQPVANQTYDVNAFNYDAVQKIIDRKSIDLESIDWSAISQSIKILTPINKPEEFAINVTFKIRNEEETFKVIYTTPSHIVFISTNPDNTQPRVMNWDTFSHQSPRIIATATQEEESK